MYIRPHPYGMRPDVHGISHGLNKCPPDTYLHQCAHWCRPFESYSSLHQKKKPHRMVWFSFGGDWGTRTLDLMRVKHAL